MHRLDLSPSNPDWYPHASSALFCVNQRQKGFPIPSISCDVGMTQFPDHQITQLPNYQICFFDIGRSRRYPPPVIHPIRSQSSQFGVDFSQFTRLGDHQILFLSVPLCLRGGCSGFAFSIPAILALLAILAISFLICVYQR